MTTSTIPSKSLVVLSPSSSSASANIERLLCPENGLFRAILHILRQFSYLHQQESIHSLLSLLGFRESKETSTVLAVVGTVQESTVALSEGGIRLGCHCSRRGSVTGTNWIDSRVRKNLFKPTVTAFIKSESWKSLSIMESLPKTSR